MPAYWKSRKMIGLKAVTFFSDNESTEFDAHQGAMLLYDGQSISRFCVPTRGLP